MAVNVKDGPSKLKITFDNGVDEKGKTKKRTKTYSNIKPSANDQDVYDVATTFVGLQVDTALEIGRLDEKEITKG